MVSIFFLMRSSIPFLAKFDKLEIFLKKAKYAYTINKHINTSENLIFYLVINSPASCNVISDPITN